MIEYSRNFPFGGRLTAIHTRNYSCQVSTAKEGLFEKQSTMVAELPFGQEKLRRGVAKIIYASSLLSSDRLQMHDAIVQVLNDSGESMSLGSAIDGIGQFLKGRGIATEVVNIAQDGITMIPHQVMRPDCDGLSIGPYKLTMDIRDLSGLTEASPEEYDSLGRRFDGEKIYHAPAFVFLNLRWDVLLAAVNGTVYKIALSLSLSDMATANEAVRMTMARCKKILGSPTKHQPRLCIWDTIDGNVIFQTTIIKGGYLLNIFLTSNMVINFQPCRS